MRPEPPPNITDPSDVQLAPLFQQGVPGVLEILHSRHQAIFRCQAMGLAQGSNRFTADDLLHAHYLRLCERHTQYDPAKATDKKNPWQPWASTLLFHLGISWIRNETRQRERTGQGDQDGIVNDPGPLDETIGRELEGSVNNCLEQLPPNQRQVMTLHLAGFSNPQIANELKMSVEEVGRLLFHARNNMAACLRQQGWEVNR
jgi:RNA polymerase sigma factor (sigma-70 family)